MHPTTTKALRDYARLRDRRWARPSSPAFFLNLRGQRLRKSEFNGGFAKLIGQVGLEGAGERVPPATARSEAHAGCPHYLGSLVVCN